MDSIAIQLALAILKIAAEKAPDILAAFMERDDGKAFRKWVSERPNPATPGKTSKAIGNLRRRARGVGVGK